MKVLLALALALPAAAQPPAMTPPAEARVQAGDTPKGPQGYPPTVVFLSDFGSEDDSVAVCKGVMWGVLPGLRIVDITHDAPVFDISAASRLVDGTAPFYPAGTVFVAVVDPGVGTERKPIAVRTKAGRIYVGPDNGLFSRVVAREGFDAAVELSNTAYHRPQTSDTFHGRDLFSPVAAHLANGVALDRLGPKVAAIVELERPAPKADAGLVIGTIEFIERPYGNVITDIPMALVDRAGLRIGEKVGVEIGTRKLELPLRKTFGDVAVGEALALPSSRGVMSFSINQGDFARRYGIVAGQKVRVWRASR